MSTAIRALWEQQTFSLDSVTREEQHSTDLNGPFQSRAFLARKNKTC
jgi:hypothetical protein